MLLSNEAQEARPGREKCPANEVAVGLVAGLLSVPQRKEEMQLDRSEPAKEVSIRWEI